MLKESIEKIKEKSIKDIKELKDSKALEELRIKYLGKKGELKRNERFSSRRKTNNRKFSK